MPLPEMPTPFGWEVQKIIKDRTVEGLGLSEETELILREHMRGENTSLRPPVVREIADALGVDWRNGAAEAQALSSAACWYLFMRKSAA